jgi:hypothetical protein
VALVLPGLNFEVSLFGLLPFTVQPPVGGTPGKCRLYRWGSAINVFYCAYK